jgi:hypothetical protein
VARPKSNIRVYWVCWLICVLLLLALRFTAFLSSSEDARFYLITIFALSTWLATGIVNFYESHRLRKYLRDNHSDFFKKITYSTTGFFNIHSIPFLFSKEDLGDQNVSFLKSNVKRFWGFALTQFLMYPVLILIVLIDQSFIRRAIEIWNQ